MRDKDYKGGGGGGDVSGREKGEKEIAKGMRESRTLKMSIRRSAALHEITIVIRVGPCDDLVRFTTLVSRCYSHPHGSETRENVSWNVFHCHPETSFIIFHVHEVVTSMPHLILRLIILRASEISFWILVYNILMISVKCVEKSFPADISENH